MALPPYPHPPLRRLGPLLQRVEEAFQREDRLLDNGLSRMHLTYLTTVWTSLKALDDLWEEAGEEVSAHLRREVEEFTMDTVREGLVWGRLMQGHYMSVIYETLQEEVRGLLRDGILQEGDLPLLLDLQGAYSKTSFKDLLSSLRVLRELFPSRRLATLLPPPLVKEFQELLKEGEEDPSLEVKLLTSCAAAAHRLAPCLQEVVEASTPPLFLRILLERRDAASLLMQLAQKSLRAPFTLVVPEGLGKVPDTSSEASLGLFFLLASPGSPYDPLNGYPWRSFLFHRLLRALMDRQGILPTLTLLGTILRQGDEPFLQDLVYLLNHPEAEEMPVSWWLPLARAEG